MPTAVLRGAAVVAASLVTAAALSQPAHADTTTFTDKGGHLTTVLVAHGKQNVRVDANVGSYRIGSHFSFWFDTDANNAGPEYKIKVYPNSDGIGLRRVGSFGAFGKTVDCGGLRATADAFGSEHVTIKVPRSCLGTPSKVRVAVRAYYDVAGPNVIDWGPGTKKFFGWVQR